jgi:NAD(P)-dependent dehydrogenase (short-subunit alcohol dehydrogenase family)
LEAMVEALAIEVAPFGLQATLLEPGRVSSGALDDVTTYTLAGDPYAALLGGGASRGEPMTPEDVARGVADAAEVSRLPLRIPLGAESTHVLAAHRQASDDVPFTVGA